MALDKQTQIYLELAKTRVKSNETDLALGGRPVGRILYYNGYYHVLTDAGQDIGKRRSYPVAVNLLATHLAKGASA